MARNVKPAAISRRSLLRSAVAAGGAAAASALSARALANGENLPPNVADWSKYLGAGVDAKPYGAPSEHEKEVVRRHVRWLTASTESSVNFTPIHQLDAAAPRTSARIGRLSRS